MHTSIPCQHYPVRCGTIPHAPIRFRTLPHAPVRFRTFPHAPVRFRRLPHALVRFRTLPHAPVRFRTLPRAPVRFRTLPHAPGRSRTFGNRVACFRMLRGSCTLPHAAHVPRARFRSSMSSHTRTLLHTPVRSCTLPQFPSISRGVPRYPARPPRQRRPRMNSGRTGKTFPNVPLHAIDEHCVINVGVRRYSNRFY